MRYMNDYDFNRAERVARSRNTPNRLAVIITVARLANWADHNSDGWAYWAKPRRAAQSAIAAIEGDGTNAADNRPDMTLDEVKAVMRPIRAFLTRHQVEQDKRDHITSPVDTLGA